MYDDEPSLAEQQEINERLAAARREKIAFSMATGNDTHPGHRGVREGLTRNQQLVLLAARKVVDKLGFIKYKDLICELNGAVRHPVETASNLKKSGRFPFKFYGRDRARIKH